LIEVALALTLLAVIMIGLGLYAANARGQLKMRNDAQQLNAVARAAEQFVAANKAAWLADPNFPVYTPTNNVTKTYTITDLQNAGLLPETVKGTLSNKQTLKLVVKHIEIPSTPKPINEVVGLVVSEGATLYGDEDMGRISMLAGSSAGYVQEAKNSLIRGTGGAWEDSVLNWDSKISYGHVAALINAGYSHGGGGGGGGGDAGGTCDWCLARVEIDGKPEYNRMDTDLDMGDKTIKNAKQIEVAKIVGQNDGDIDLAVKAGKQFRVEGNTYINANDGVTIGTTHGNYLAIKGNKYEVSADEFNLRARFDIYRPEWVSMIRFSREKGGDGRANFNIYFGDPDSIYFDLFGWHGHATSTYWTNLKVGGEISSIGFGNVSDRRLKKNIRSLPNALEQISRLQGMRFDWKMNDKSDIGLIAQEVEIVYPELVRTDENGLKTVTYGNLVAPLIEAVKTLKTRNETLQTALDAQQKALDEERVERIKLKHAVKLPLSDAERAQCGKDCA
jgi:type II secretory pathway pseudopilin PulG